MSSHIGVSCDVCLKTNFSDRRYKCLICDNYDLCGSCYDGLAESQTHSSNHPMQCILTKTAHDLFYTGENLAHRSIVSLTCPHCNRSGYLPRTLLVHCIEDHSQLTNHQDPNSTKQLVMCPICVLLPSQDYTNRFVSLTDHLARDHEGETSIPWSNANLQRRNLENKRELVDDDDDDGEDIDDDDDDIDCVPFNILVERVFLKEQSRRQESSILHHHHHHHQHQHQHQRRTLSRQTTLRASRHTLRGHYHPSTSYSTVTYSGLNGLRVPYDPPMASESYYDMLYAQNPIEFHSPTLLDDPHHFPPPLSSYIPSLKQYDHDQINALKKSAIVNIRQKRSCQNPIQSSFASMSLADDQRWQEQLSLFSTNNDDSSKSTFRFENDSRSLIGKFLKEIEPSVTDHSKETQRHLFAKSILLSSIGLRKNKL